MIATFPMYDWPEQVRHWDAFWGHVGEAMRARGIDAPRDLSRGKRLWDYWEAPDLVIGQTCGLPYRTQLHDKVALIGALDHALPGCPAGYYNSVLIVPADNEKNLAESLGGTLAYNGTDSQSGWAAAQNAAATVGGTFRRTAHSGSHRASAAMVAEGSADIACVDAQTWRLIQRLVPHVAEKVRVLDRTEPTPGLPLIAHLGSDRELVFEAIEAGIAATPQDTLDELDIRGVTHIPADAYLSIRTPPLPSQADAAQTI